VPRKLYNALTPIAVKNAAPGRHADGGGLYLRVQAGGGRSWLFRATMKGKARDIGLGPASGPGAISLAEARASARELAAQAAKGETLEGKRARSLKAAETAALSEALAKTFKQVAEEHIERKESDWRNEKHRQQWRNTLATYVYPIIGDMPVKDIDTEHVMKVLQPIWNEKPETASRVRGRIENVLAAAKVLKLRSGENPALWRGHLDQLLSKGDKLRRGHHEALPYADLPLFMATLSDRTALAARALEFTIMTAARTGETLGATWREVDLDNSLWIIPKERMKMGKEHRVPLAPQALDILIKIQPLNTLKNKDAPLFPGTDGFLSNMAMAMLLRRMGQTDTTVHGFRSTFRDWAGECTSFPREVVEHALAHQLADKAEAAYQRGTLFPKRIKLMQAWADYCTSSTVHEATAVEIPSASQLGQLPWPLTTINFEASALGWNSWPIEVGISRWSSPKSTLEGWSSLIQPTDAWLQNGDWSADSAKAHRIARKELQRGMTPATVMHILNQLLANQIVWCDGMSHQHWLNKLAQAAGIAPSFSLGDIHMLASTLIPAQYQRMMDWGALAPTMHRARANAEMRIKALAHGLGYNEIQNVDWVMPHNRENHG